MFEELNCERLASLERYKPEMLAQFASFLKVRDVIGQWYAGKLKTLVVTPIDEYNVDATYLNNTVRFSLMFTYNIHNRPTGKVVCLRKNTGLGKEHYDYLGAFSFDVNGNTSLPEHPQRGARTLINNADEVVVAYLDKAIQEGPRWLSDAVTEAIAATA